VRSAVFITSVVFYDARKVVFRDLVGGFSSIWLPDRVEITDNT
jgi:hypothetical protein